MKKLIKVVALLTVVLAMSVFMMGCSSDFGKVESALKGIGYEKIEKSSQGENIAKESDVPVTAYFFENSQKVNLVLVLEFKATKDMKEFFNDSSTMQGLVKDIEKDGTAEEIHKALEEKGLAKGNCLVLSIINLLEWDNVTDAIKKA